MIEVELAFMYDYIYSSNAFVHYYEAGACTAWAIASILTTCWQLLPGPCWVIYSALYKLFGLQYIQQVLTDMLGISTASSIQLPIEVKSAVIDALVGILMPRPNHDSVVLSSGSTSLAKNGLQDKFIRQYASTSYHGGRASTIIPESKGNQASIILTWHAATGCYDKDYEQRKKMKATTESPLQHRQYRVVATALSKYCMYLVAYVPQLLPGQQSYTTSVYNDFVRSPSYILQSGTQLKDELCEAVVEDELRWKVLADFWVEMLLYLAPSDNVTAHIEQLAQGGEFITHLWALLFHAGILQGGGGASCSRDSVTNNHLIINYLVFSSLFPYFLCL